MKKIFWSHIFPFSLALITLALVYKPLLSLYNTQEEVRLYTSADLKGEKRFLSNYNHSVLNELQVARSLIRPNQLTVFGSSELSNGVGNYLPCNFFPDSLGAPVLAIGHGYHELFAIYCELLYFKSCLKNSKINIVLSPGWFEDGKGTLPQSFLEFVPPHFITQIIRDSTIKAEHKEYLAKIVASNYQGEIAGKRLEYKYLQALSNKVPLANELEISLLRKHELTVINDNPVLNLKNPNWSNWLKKAKKNSLSTLNEHFIDSSYFKKYTSDKSGNIRKMKMKPIPHRDNQELQDLKMILKLVKENNCEVSFVMQPLNPYYFENFENFAPIMDSIIELMAKNKLSSNYLNLFVIEEEKYTPGILKDVMHFSEYGWMTVNKFLYERHFNK